MSNTIPNPKNLGININRPGKFQDQRWLVAHNAWNTEQSPANQCKTITELLDYGVRGLALDIYGDDENSLHLQHVHGNLISRKAWEPIRNEIWTWLENNPTEIVTLFFESYLTGPEGGETPEERDKLPLVQLSKSLDDIPYYRPGRVNQEAAMLNKDISVLINGIPSHRLFAFIEKEPNEGTQTIFPVMQATITENEYGDGSLRKGSWVDLRSDSKTGKPLKFMNHFGSRPTGSEWDRNNPDLIIQHAEDFKTKFTRYPNFISLDYINWADDNNGPIEALRGL